MNNSQFLRRTLHLGLALCCSGVAGSFVANAQTAPTTTDLQLYPNNLLVSRSVYDNKAGNIAVGTILPPNCITTLGGCSPSSGAPYDGTYPYVFNDDIYDGNFGITARIYLDQISVTGTPINSIEVLNSDETGLHTTNRLVTSFSSKSELALNLSTDGKFVTFMGYVAPVNAIDISNSNTPRAIDTTNPDGQTPTYRAIAFVGADARMDFIETNAYSGNNGRAAIYNNSHGGNVFYTAGNAGNGSNPQPEGVVLGAGAQLVAPLRLTEASQYPGLPTPVASFSVTELGQKADKIGKDDNFRGMTVFNNVLYYSKGSGGNGVNTVYFVDTTGKACPNGVGLPSPTATLPVKPLTYDPTTVATVGLPNNMCILAGFPSITVKKSTTLSYPFGMWFANAHTLYVADEGDGYTGGSDLYTHAAAQTTAGLQKWVFNSTSQTWQMVYVLNQGLGIGTPYTVAGYPTGNNAATGLPWAPATDGLRNITGAVGPNGQVAIWGITSTISGNGDVGADPNQLVVVVDSVANTNPSLAGTFSFETEKAAKFGEVLRGVSFTPDTNFALFTQE